MIIVWSLIILVIIFWLIVSLYLFNSKPNFNPPKPIEKSNEIGLWKKNLYKTELEQRYINTNPFIQESLESQYRVIIYKNGKKIHKSKWYVNEKSAMDFANYFIKCDSEKNRKPYEWVDIKVNN